MTRRAGRIVWALLLTSLAAAPLRSDEGRTPPERERFAISAPPEELRLDPFYKKSTTAAGLPVLGSARVSDFALKEAAYLITRMLAARPELPAALKKNGLRFVVMAYDERTTDVPEQRGMKPKDFWDVRARGLGASKGIPIVSCGEENLLGYPSDPYKGENILIHEFAHAMHNLGLVDVDPTFDARLRRAHEAAVAKGLWKGTYAATDHQEYWAEGVQSWFDCNLAPPDFQHNEVNTRAELKAYDPALAALVAEVYGDTPWTYIPPAQRPDRATGHLAGYDPAQAPRFSWGAAEKKHDEVVAEKRRLRKEEAERRAAPAK